MDLKTKRKNEIETLKEKRKEEVIAGAIEVLKEKGIDNTKITDIAERAEIGSATIYRYFNTKPELVIEAATKYWEVEMGCLYATINQELYGELNGLDKVKCLLGVFVELYKNHKEFIRFVEDFDNYIVREKVPIEKLELYEKNITFLKEFMFMAMEEGKKENLIEETIDDNEFYISITHALMSLCQKLSIRGEILKSDNEVVCERQIELISEMAIKFIIKSRI